MLIKYENVSVTRNPFGRYVADGIMVDESGKEIMENGAPTEVKKNESYLLHGHEHNGAVELQKKYVRYSTGAYAGQTHEIEQGPKAFGALFFFITGFHGFHVLSGVIFLLLIMVNAMSGLYASRKNGYEMVEKIGLYWHFVDLVWVFVFLVFYLL
jgi:cytochrome c oxidase subunit 3